MNLASTGTNEDDRCPRRRDRDLDVRLLRPHRRDQF